MTSMCAALYVMPSSADQATHVTCRTIWLSSTMRSPLRPLSFLVHRQHRGRSRSADFALLGKAQKLFSNSQARHKPQWRLSQTPQNKKKCVHSMNDSCNFTAITLSVGWGYTVSYRTTRKFWYQHSFQLTSQHDLFSGTQLCTIEVTTGSLLSHDLRVCMLACCRY